MSDSCQLTAGFHLIISTVVSCPPSMSYASPAEVLNDVRLFTSNFGVVTSIKAYWDRHKARQLNDPLRAAMPSMGVNLIDCSSMQGYTDDALTKMLTGQFRNQV